MNHAYTATDTKEQARAAYAGQKGVELDRMRLRDTKLLQHTPEFADRMNLAGPTFFPSVILIQINHSIGVRHIRPKGVDKHEIFQMLFGYEDDTPEMTRMRLLSANLVGPAGLVSMEDGEAIEIITKAAASAPRSATNVIEMGGRGPVRDETHRVTESPVRGFWSYWSELMGVEPAGGIR